MAFADDFDMAYVVRQCLKEIKNLCILLTLMAKTHSLFDVITRATCITETRLMTGLHAAKDAYQALKANDVAYKILECNIAEALRKGKEIFALFETLQSGYLGTSHRLVNYQKQT